MNIKPHFRIMGAVSMSNELTAKPDDLPAYLRDRPKEHRIGNIDQSDLIVPRIKLINGLSPELNDFPNQARAGEFWHTLLQETMGPEISGVPIYTKKTYMLWGPRGGEPEGLLARADDGVHWDPPDEEFVVKFPNNPKKYKWRTARTVAESGLDVWGSSMPEDPRSKPAAQLTYNVLWYFPEWRDAGVALMMSARSGANDAQKLFSMIESSPRDHYYQRYRIKAVSRKAPTGNDFWAYQYLKDGWADEALGEHCRNLFLRWKGLAFRAADETDDADHGAGGAGGSGSHGDRRAGEEDIPF